VINLLWNSKYCSANELHNVPDTLWCVESNLIKGLTSNEHQKEEYQDGKIELLMEEGESVENWLDETGLIDYLQLCTIKFIQFIHILFTQWLCKVFELFLCETKTDLCLIFCFNPKYIRGCEHHTCTNHMDEDAVFEELHWNLWNGSCQCSWFLIEIYEKVLVHQVSYNVKNSTNQV